MARRPSATASIKRLKTLRRELELMQAEAKELTDLVREMLGAVERDKHIAHASVKTRRKRAELSTSTFCILVRDFSSRPSDVPRHLGGVERSHRSRRSSSGCRPRPAHSNATTIGSGNSSNAPAI